MKLLFVIDRDYDVRLAGKDLEPYLDYQYEILGKHLDNARESYQGSWDQINDAFSVYVYNRTGHDWFYSEYECVVSVFQRGASNWGHAPKIVRWWKENAYSMRRITAHELILSHYFEIYRRNYSESGLTDGQVWALAEIAAISLTSLPQDVKNFWPWDTQYYTNHNYPQIVQLQKELRGVFVEKQFDEYILEGISRVRAYPSIGP